MPWTETLRLSRVLARRIAQTAADIEYRHPVAHLCVGSINFEFPQFKIPRRCPVVERFREVLVSLLQFFRIILHALNF